MSLDMSITSNPNRLAQTLAITKERTWEKYAEPFRMLDHVYCIATTFASQYLVETSEGLVMLDAGWHEMEPFTIDSIHRLGFDPRDIRHLFLTHGHFDHVGGARLIQEISGHCKTYMAPGDMFFFTERRDLIVPGADADGRCPEFKVDVLYDYETVYKVGDTEFWAVHCPGHTPGTSSVFCKTTHRGKEVICAIHGGMALNGMSRKELKANGLPYSLQRDYMTNMEKAMKMRVDCYLPAHQFGYDVLALKQEDDGTGDIFVNPEVWPRVMRNAADSFMKAFGTEMELPED